MNPLTYTSPTFMEQDSCAACKNAVVMYFALSELQNSCSLFSTWLARHLERHPGLLSEEVFQLICNKLESFRMIINTVMAAQSEAELLMCVSYVNLKDNNPGIIQVSDEYNQAAMSYLLDMQASFADLTQRLEQVTPLEAHFEPLKQAYQKAMGSATAFWGTPILHEYLTERSNKADSLRALFGR